MGSNNKKPLRISVDETNQRSSKNVVTFLDVIDEGSYKEYEYKIEGAVRIAPKDIKDEYDVLSEENEIMAY
jgi:hypothetical protein